MVIQPLPGALVRLLSRLVPRVDSVVYWGLEALRVRLGLLLSWVLYRVYNFR